MRKLILISPFPPKGSTYKSKHSALASFGKNKVDSMLKADSELRVVVLADKYENDGSWEDERVEVRRVWKRGSILSYFGVFREILREKDSKEILVEMEWALLGKNQILIIPFPFLLLLTRALGKKNYIVTHGVSLDFSSLSPQLGIKKKSFKSRVYNFGLNAFYFLLVRSAKKIITLERDLADKINGKMGGEKAVFIPHGVDTKLKTVKKDKARDLLGLDKDEFLIVNFGFLSWYKGSDLLAQAFYGLIKNKPKEKLRLVFAGGPSSVHKNNLVYAEFIEKLEEVVGKSEKMKITGFVKDEEIPLYFSAADLLVLPYRQFISSSGPLSLAFTFERPVVLSEKLRNYFVSPDIKESAKKSGLAEKDLLFELNSKSLAEKIRWGKREVNYKKLLMFSRLMRKKRAWELVGKKYVEMIYR